MKQSRNKLTALILAVMMLLGLLAYSAAAADGDDVTPYGEQKIILPIQKIWNDENAAAGLRPVSVTLQLYRYKEGSTDKELIDTKAVSEDNEWKAEFDVTDKAFYKENGQWHSYLFEVTEYAVPNYTETDHKDPEVFLTISENIDWERTEPNNQLTHEIVTSGSEVSFVVAKKGNKSFIWTVHKLTELEQEIIFDEITSHQGFQGLNIDGAVFLSGIGAGSEYGITVTENQIEFDRTATWSFYAVGGYARSSASQYAGSITNKVETVDVTVEKVWENADGSGTWPEGKTVTVKLTADGAPNGLYTELSADKTSYTFENLPKYQADGTTEIVYGLDEVEAPGYTPSVGSLTNGKITVTNKQITTEVTVEKVWENADGSDTWPEGKTVAIQLTADGDAVSGKTATLTADQPSYKFENLPKYQADGTTEIVYGVDEVEVPGYESGVSGPKDGKITVINTQITTEITVEKEWADANGSIDWPEDTVVSLQLLAGGNAVKDKTATLSADQPSYKFEKLPKYDDKGEEIEYSVGEADVPGYGSEVGELKDGKITVTNTLITTEVTVEKVWKNADGSSTWPEGKTARVKLTADGTPNGLYADLTADMTSYTFTNLPKYQADGSTEIVYGLDEVVADGYEVSYGPLTDGRITVTNTQITVDVEIEKVWANADGSDAWPEGKTVKVQLTADGKAVDGKSDELSASKKSVKFESLPKFQADGKTQIKYAAEEVTVPGYETEVGAISDGKITITNTQLTVEAEIKVRKELVGRDWVLGDSFTFKLAGKDGAPMPESDSVTVTDDETTAFGTITYSEEGTYEYTVTEEDGGIEGLTYDSAEHTVTVTVTLSDDNKLTAEVKYENGDTETFQNEYHAKGEFELSAKKTLKNGSLKAGQFSFELKDAEGNTVETVENKDDGTITFSAIAVDETVFEEGETEKVLTFTVSEVIPEKKAKNMTYDTRVYTAAVTLKDEGNGKITATIAWKADGKDASSAEFVNTYEEEETPTGDSGLIYVYAAVALLALLGLAFTGLLYSSVVRQNRARHLTR